MGQVTKSFWEACYEADRRYRSGQLPTKINLRRWELARAIQRKVAAGGIPHDWESWSIERLQAHFNWIAEKKRKGCQDARPR